MAPRFVPRKRNVTLLAIVYCLQASPQTPAPQTPVQRRRIEDHAS